MAHRITLIPGDGIGPEVSAAVVRIIEAAGVVVEWEEHHAGVTAVEQSGSTLPQALLDSVTANRVALKGPVTTPVGEGFTSVNVGLRKALDLYANLRPVSNLPGVPSRFQGVDMVIVRENTEDLYAGLENEIVPGVVAGLKVITAVASERIARFAFRHAVDNACMQLVMRPEQFDVLLLPNLYGDIVSDLGAGLVGGLGVVPGANLGERSAVFEAVHGSAPDIAGLDVANPTALLLSALMMLRHIGERTPADVIFGAVSRVLAAGATLTRDLGGTASTTQYTDAVVGEIHAHRS